MSSLAPTPPQSRLAAACRSLRHRNFQLFFSGQLISLIGTWMQNVAQSWLVYRLTGSALLLGAVGFASQIPIFILSPIGGAIVDRRNRHRIIIATQTLSMILAFILAALTLFKVVQVWHIFVLAALLGFVNAFDIPARQAFIVEMVGKDDLMNAIALNSSMFNGARIVGPAVAGILVASIGEGWCFFANAVSYFAVLAGLLMMKVAPWRPKERITSALSDIREGFEWVIGTRPIFALLLLVGLVSLVGMPYAVLMPVFAEDILHSGARGLGILMGFSGAGALIGALALAAKSGLRGLSTWVASSSAAFGAFLILFGYSRIFWASAALLIPVGLFMMVQMAATNTLIQSMVPDDLRGESDVGLFHDDDGHGPTGRAARWGHVGANGRSAHRGDRRSLFHFGLNLVWHEIAGNPCRGSTAHHRSSLRRRRSGTRDHHRARGMKLCVASAKLPFTFEHSIFVVDIPSPIPVH